LGVNSVMEAWDITICAANFNVSLGMGNLPSFLIY
jgi:hypothetical protein